MKITDVRCEMYAWPTPRVMSSGRGRGKQKYTHRTLALIFIETDEGIIGVGAGNEANEFEKLKPKLLGMDPLCHEKIWDKLFYDRRGQFDVKTISVIDIALWDLKAKVAGLPLYKLLGGYRDKLECYIAGGYYAEGKTMMDLQKEMEEYLEMGATAVKMKVGGLTPREDALRVKAVREVLGEENKLLIDANCAWNCFEAIEFCKRVEEFFPYWLEEPCSFTDNEGFIKLAQHTSIPLAAGESVFGKYEHRDLIDTGAISFVQPDATLCGGVTETIKIGAYADAHHILIAPHGKQQVHVHLNCAMRNAAITEFYPPQFDRMAYDAYQYPVKINSDGTISPPEHPGASFDVNPEALKPYRIK